ncbi:hypothetical protein L917_14512 [Phytophthora nicotianae]|uniref:Uncharacterized protein n=2 Tax=Phytophthora nicotianae TaxID=4792 RepID=V9EJI9_PHYNI|nr:hypothetical protein F443_15251 [Phytophthora nicotianae P1569]ETL86010.1 hypothetical protein L917_14512 [Phytophthora nicotianae]
MEEAPSPPDTQQTTAAPPTPSASTPRKSNVYSRLYDPKSYTGVYKKRFEADCNDLTERVVHDLSNAMRTNLNHDVNRPKQRTASSRNNSGSSTLAPALSPTAASAERPTSAPPVQEKLQGDPNDPHTLLKAVFHYYCRFGRTGPKGLGEKTLDNSNFVKLCRDCPDLLNSSFGKTDVDLIFVKAKKKGERRINYARFLDALGMIAIQKYGDMVHFELARHSRATSRILTVSVSTCSHLRRRCRSCWRHISHICRVYSSSPTARRSRQCGRSERSTTSLPLQKQQSKLHRQLRLHLPQLDNSTPIHLQLKWTLQQI